MPGIFQVDRTILNNFGLQTTICGDPLQKTEVIFENPFFHENDIILFNSIFYSTSS